MTYESQLAQAENRQDVFSKTFLRESSNKGVRDESFRHETAWHSDRYRESCGLRGTLGSPPLRPPRRVLRTSTATSFKERRPPAGRFTTRTSSPHRTKRFLTEPMSR